jgi:hypothetical protein
MTTKAQMTSLEHSGVTTSSKLTGAFGKFSAFMTGPWGAAIMAAGALVVGVGIAAVNAFREAEKVMAQTESVIESTGGAANVTANDVSTLASNLAYMSGVDDDLIQSGENLLLTFVNIRNEVGKGNDIFNQATGTVLDMSVALDQDMKSSAIQLGKALNDPIKGITALQRVGVSFTEEQKKQIEVMVENNDILGAQKIILGELQTEFGGSAEAAGNTFAGAIGKLKVAFGDLLEIIGKPIATALTFLVNGFTALIGMFTQTGDKAAQMSGPMSYLVTAFKLLTFTGQTLWNFLKGFFQTIEPGIQKIVGLAQALGDKLAPVFSWIGDAIDFVMPLFEEFGKVVGEVFNGIIDWAVRYTEDFVNVIIDGINLVIHAINGLIRAYNLLPGHDDIETIEVIQDLEIAQDDTAESADVLAEKEKKAGKEVEKTGNKAAKAAHKFRQWARDINESAQESITSLGGIEVATNRTARTFLQDSHSMLRAAQQSARGIKQLSRQDWVPNAYKRWLVSEGPEAVANFQRLTRRQQEAAISDWKDTQEAAETYETGVNALEPKVETETQEATSNFRTLNEEVAWLKQNNYIGVSVHTSYTSSGTPPQIPQGVASGGILGMAAGGITQRPVFMVGEGGSMTFAGKGAEAVIPLNNKGINILAEAVRRGQESSKPTPAPVINLTVNGFAGDEEKLANLMSRKLATMIRDGR